MDSNLDLDVNQWKIVYLKEARKLLLEENQELKQKLELERAKRIQCELEISLLKSKAQVYAQQLKKTTNFLDNIAAINIDAKK